MRGGVVTLMPEGTRSLDGRLQAAQPGRLAAGDPDGRVGCCRSASRAPTRLLGRGRRLPRIGTRVTLRVGRPFTLALDGDDRRAALAAADAAAHATDRGARGSPPPRRLGALADKPSP